MATKKKISRYNTRKARKLNCSPDRVGRSCRNLLGIADKREMDKAEYQALLRVQGAYLAKIDAETRFTATLISRMHRDWLGKVLHLGWTLPNSGMQKGAFRREPNVSRGGDIWRRWSTFARPTKTPSGQARTGSVAADCCGTRRIIVDPPVP